MNELLAVPLKAVAIFLVVLLTQVPLLYALLKVSAHVMARVGPMYAGRFHGIGQPIAEFVKWIQKEDIVPADADKPVFRWAPLVALLPAFLVFAVIPVAPGIVGAETELGLFFVLSLSAVGAIAVVMAAYASQSKFTLVGGLRAVGQIIAYELPIVLGAVSIAMLADSMSLTEIVEAQNLPFIVNPAGLIAFVLFLLASFAEVLWPPFDMPVAESEIIAGPYTEYSGMRFIFFYISEFCHVLALSALGTLLFFGGWRGPILPPVIWFVAKMSGFVIFFIWVRFTMPRLREDQLQKLAWKLLIPIGLLNVLGIAFFRVLW